MATMRPDLSEARLEALPKSEANFYRACRDRLPKRVLVHYGIQTLNDSMEEGEVDFVIFDPRHGMLVVEVKGGGVSIDDGGQWWTKNSRREVKDIRDPVKQARDRMHDLERRLTASPRWKSRVPGRITRGYAIALPDLMSWQADGLKSPGIKRPLIATAEDLERLPEWLAGAFAMWRKPDEIQIGDGGVHVASDLLCPPFEALPLIPVRLRDLETARVRLTEDQAAILEFLDGRKQVAISGGAGTGKTLLAVKQATALAQRGGRPLLLCYNRPLADHLKQVVGPDSGVHAMSLHELFEWWASVMSKKTGRNLLAEADRDHPGKSRTDVQLPHAFTVCLDEFEPPPFDAIVVDEGQDFRDDDWLAVETLRDKTDSSLAVFHDHNQELYRKADYFPIRDENLCFRLSRNCRNTRPIHDATYKFYRGPLTREPALDGEPVVSLEGSDPAQQARCIHERVRDLLGSGAQPHQLAVLLITTDGGKKRLADRLRSLPLQAGVGWSYEVHGAPGAVLIDSAARFKGLEREIVVLWVDPEIDAGTHRELLYVGMSRAKSFLFLAGTADACKRVLARSLIEPRKDVD